MTLNQEVPAYTLLNRESTAEIPSIRLTRKPEETAPMLGVGRNGVYDLIRTGQLRSIRVGRKILIPLAAIEEFLGGTGGTK